MREKKEKEKKPSRTVKSSSIETQPTSSNIPEYPEILLLLLLLLLASRFFTLPSYSAFFLIRLLLGLWQWCFGSSDHTQILFPSDPLQFGQRERQRRNMLMIVQEEKR